jgi:hypothetical protein
MVHPWNHEETVVALYVGSTTHKIEDAVVIIDAVKRRDGGVALAVVLQQLSAAPEKIAQIRISGFGGAVIDAIGHRY